MRNIISKQTSEDNFALIANLCMKNCKDESEKMLMYLSFFITWKKVEIRYFVYLYTSQFTSPRK